MKKCITRIILCCTAAALFLMAFIQPALASEKEETVLRLPFRDLAADEITDEMGLGWNLGNTMDGHSAFMPSETAWQSVVTTSELIDAVHDAGFNTLRLPVTWGLKIDDENNYTIDEAWMRRVREIADYALRQDMYVIVNVHHDGAEQTGWLRVAYEGEELDVVKQKYAQVWDQIATAFAGYDEHVIFESMNEVKSDDDTKEGVIRDFKVIGELNQIFVDTVRSTGGNNTRRWLLVPGRYTNIVNTTNEDNGFALPEDKWNEENRLMVSVHDYDYSFGLLDTMGITKWSEDSAKKMSVNFQKLIDWFTSKDIPVVLGEYGASNKNNTEARTYYYEVMARLSRVSGVVCCLWDNGWYDKSIEPADYSMALFDRETGEQVYPEIVKGILRGHYFADKSAGVNDINSIVLGTKENPVQTIPIKEITLSQDTLSLTAGSWAEVTAKALPDDTNETIAFYSSNPSVATVYNGLIRAKSIGRCVVYAASASGDIAQEIEVTVYPNEELKMPLDELNTDAEAYTVPVSGAKKIEVSVAEGSDDVVTFVSSDESVAYVSTLGEITGKSVGTAWITMTSSSGLIKTVKVNVVPEISEENSMEIAINAYYNDSEHEFYNNCRGESVIVSGNGTYTLSFDCDEHLIKAAVDAGVDSLSGVGAIYIADVEGRNGLLSSCDIFYEAVLLDGQELTITQTEPKSALKTGDRFDTNDPVNAWDGSAVSEAVAQDYMVSFEGYENPKTITVTFTLSNFVLAKDAEEETAEMIPAEIILSADEPKLDSSEAVRYEVTLSPKNTTDTVSFVSSNPMAVWVDCTSVSPDKNGIATADLIPIGEGEATVTIRTQSGDTKEIKVISETGVSTAGGNYYEYAQPVVLATAKPSEEVAAEPVTATPSPEAEATPAIEIISELDEEKSSVAVPIIIGALIGGAVLIGIVFGLKAYMKK